MVKLFALALLALTAHLCNAQSVRTIEKQILDTILYGYDARIRPNGENGK